MGAYEAKTGGGVLAIAHNGNLSNGLMFPSSRNSARRSTVNTPKHAPNGSGSTKPRRPRVTARPIRTCRPTTSSPISKSGTKAISTAAFPRRKMLEFEYARSAFKNGLKLEKELGTNPYKFGLISSSDAHTGLAAMEEDNFFGKTIPQEPSPDRMIAIFVDNKQTGVKIMDWEDSSSGYAAVWAKENTRHPSGMRCRERKPTRRPVRAWSCAFSAAGISRTRMPKIGCPRQVGYSQGRADGRRSERCAEGKVADIPRGRAQGPDRREPRPLPDRQGLARQGRQLQEKVYDVCVVRRPQAGRMENCRRWATRSISRMPPGPTPSALPNSSPYGKIRNSTRSTRILLRPGDRDSDSALDRL